MLNSEFGTFNLMTRRRVAHFKRLNLYIINKFDLITVLSVYLLYIDINNRKLYTYICSDYFVFFFCRVLFPGSSFFGVHTYKCSYFIISEHLQHQLDQPTLFQILKYQCLRVLRWINFLTLTLFIHNFRQGGEL